MNIHYFKAIAKKKQLVVILSNAKTIKYVYYVRRICMMYDIRIINILHADSFILYAVEYLDYN